MNDRPGVNERPTLRRIKRHPAAHLALLADALRDCDVSTISPQALEYLSEAQEVLDDYWTRSLELAPEEDSTSNVDAIV